MVLSAVLIACFLQVGEVINPAQFAAGDVENRRSSMRRAAAQVDTMGEQLLPLIEIGLQDTDAQVRFSAISAVSQLVLRAGRSSEGESAREVLLGRQSLVAVLLQALGDPDFRIRGGAVAALRVVASPLQSSVVTTLGDLYTLEPNAEVRAAVIAALGEVGTSIPDVRHILLVALTDTAADVRRRAALGIALDPFAEALGAVVAELASGDSITRPEFVAALASYRSGARPHLPLLERLLALETSESVRRQIQEAIKNIQGAR